MTSLVRWPPRTIRTSKEPTIASRASRASCNVDSKRVKSGLEAFAGGVVAESCELRMGERDERGAMCGQGAAHGSPRPAQHV
jgi:hypothetical protein